MTVITRRTAPKKQRNVASFFSSTADRFCGPISKRARTASTEESPCNDLEHGDAVNEADDDAEDAAVSDKAAAPRRDRKEWQFNHPWVRNVSVSGEDSMKCFYCMECKAEGVFGVGGGCRTMLRKSLVDYEASNTHRFSMKRVEARDLHVPLEEHASTIRHVQQNRIEAAMKIA